MARPSLRSRVRASSTPTPTPTNPCRRTWIGARRGPRGDIFGAEPGPGGVKVITLDDIDKAVRRVVQIGGMPSALALLKPYGVKKLPEVPEYKRAELHAAAEKLVEENSE